MVVIMRDLIARAMLRVGILSDRVPYIGKKLSFYIISLSCYIGSLDFYTWFMLFFALNKYDTELWVNVTNNKEIFIRIIDPSYGVCDLSFLDKSTRYARTSLRMLWFYSIIRTISKDMTHTNEKCVVSSEKVNNPVIPNRFTVPRLPESYRNKILKFPAA